jgi:hypothetical protein
MSKLFSLVNLGAGATPIKIRSCRAMVKNWARQTRADETLAQNPVIVQMRESAWL